MTVNWYLLLEKAIKSSGAEFCYNYQEGKIHILKMHGSINWIKNAPSPIDNKAKNFHYKALGYKQGLMENEIFSPDELHSTDAWHSERPLVDQVKPKIILPGFDKAFDIRELAIFWYRIENLNSRKGGVSIIRLNVSPDYFIIEKFFPIPFSKHRNLG